MKIIKETPQMAKARITALSNFRKEILQNNKRLDLEFPKRVIADTHKQEQYIYAHRNGYQVVVITSILDDHFMKTGRVWVNITEDKDLLWTRYFLKNQGYRSVLEKVLMYAQFAQNIVNERPQCPKSNALMDLYKEKESFMFQGVLKEKYVHSWKSSYADYAFKKFWTLYIKGIPLKRLKIITEKEYKTERYFKTRTTKRFASEIREVAKITKPENAVGKK